jgi:hypothetical protein
MKSRNLPSLVLIYFGALATALALAALGLTAVVKASAGLSEASAPDKTLLELQIESSREIRRALATPVAGPPQLPPITARPARDVREAAQVMNPTPKKLSREAMHAMAMDQSLAHSWFQSSSRDYAVGDRHTPY